MTNIVNAGQGLNLSGRPNKDIVAQEMWDLGGEPVDVTTERFKREWNLTITSFAKEVASYNFYSFPENTRQMASALLIAFDKSSKAYLDLQLEEAKAKIGEPAQVDKKRKEFQNLQSLQIKLFNNITTGIKEWYNNTYNGTKLMEGWKRDDISIPKNQIQANKFYFVAQRDFGYLLYE